MARVHGCFLQQAPRNLPSHGGPPDSRQPMATSQWDPFWEAPLRQEQPAGACPAWVPPADDSPFSQAGDMPSTAPPSAVEDSSNLSGMLSGSLDLPDMDCGQPSTTGHTALFTEASLGYTFATYSHPALHGPGAAASASADAGSSQADVSKSFAEFVAATVAAGAGAAVPAASPPAAERAALPLQLSGLQPPALHLPTLLRESSINAGAASPTAGPTPMFVADAGTDVQALWDTSSMDELMDSSSKLADLARRHSFEAGERGESSRDQASAVEDLERKAGYSAVHQRMRLLKGVVQERTQVLSSLDIQGIASYILSGAVKRIVCLCGAGISVSAGILDFRTPGSGLYSNLQKYNLPEPEAVFDISYFRENPTPFYLLAKELFPGTYRPTPTHHFMRLLHDKGLLLRCYTQNIDSLEHQAGLPKDAVVAAHGNFDGAHCVQCKQAHPIEYVGKAIFESDGQPCRCTVCGGLVKPDIVFFGEPLPERFFSLADQDLPVCDLLIVMGTSLVVAPFSSLIEEVGDATPRLLINREVVGQETNAIMRMLGYSRCFNFGEGNYRDALFLGDCDAGVRQLCGLLGWADELEGLVQAAVGGGPGPAGAAQGLLQEAEQAPEPMCS